MIQPKRVLVCGGAGFLGSHLCLALINQGHKVTCIDTFDSGEKRNLHPLIDHPNFELLEHDICLPLYVEVDEIYNLACPASPCHYQKDPIQTTKSSVLGSLNLLELAHKLGARILLTSTSEIYGDPHEHPQKESYWGHVNPIGPRSCYDEGKRCAETLFFDYHRMHNLDISIARIFNTYGPNMQPNDGRVVSNFIMQSIQGQEITIYGQGSQTRSFCFVSDLIDGLIKLMESGLTGPYNLGNPKEFSIEELAEMIIALTGSESQISYCTLPSDDPKRRRPDISKAIEELGWQPKVPIEEGLKETIAYFKRELALQS